MTTTPPNVLRPTDDEAIALARRLLRTARSGAIATLEPGSGAPIATRVGVATDGDGAPILLISRLSAHTPALEADPRCSLLVGESGRGDPLAHPRMTIACTARAVPRDSDDGQRLAGRYLRHQPKAELYADLPDFSYWRLEPTNVSLNGGFGRAYALSAAQLLLAGVAVESVAAVEAGAIAHMNEDHAEAVELYARHFAGAAPGPWKLIGLDPEGIDLGNGDEVRRVLFPQMLGSAGEVRGALVDMAGVARRALGTVV